MWNFSQFVHVLIAFYSQHWRFLLKVFIEAKYAQESHLELWLKYTFLFVYFIYLLSQLWLVDCLKQNN